MPSQHLAGADWGHFPASPPYSPKTQPCRHPRKSTSTGSVILLTAFAVLSAPFGSYPDTKERPRSPTASACPRTAPILGTSRAGRARRCRPEARRTRLRRWLCTLRLNAGRSGRWRMSASRLRFCAAPASSLESAQPRLTPWHRNGSDTALVVAHGHHDGTLLCRQMGIDSRHGSTLQERLLHLVLEVAKVKRPS
jgi:hypothetical protein